MESFTEHTHHLRHCKSVPDFHDDFKIRTRSNRLFALWVANLLGLTHEASEAYSEDLQMFDFYQGIQLILYHSHAHFEESVIRKSTYIICLSYLIQV